MNEEENGAGGPPSPEPGPPQQNGNERTSARKTTRSKLRLGREQLAVVILLVLTLELGLRSSLGNWRHVAVANLVAIVVLIVVLMVRAALRARRRAGDRRGASTARSHLRDLLGRKTPGGGGSRNPLRDLLGRKTPGGGGSRNPLRDLLGRKTPGGGGSRSPFGGKPTGRKTPGGGQKDPDSGGSRNPFSWKPKEKQLREKPDVKTEEKPDVKTEEKPDVKTEEKPDVKTEEKPDVKTEEKPDVKTEETEVTMTSRTDDAGIGAPRGNSLYAWGRTLPKVEEALEDLKRRHKTLEAEVDALLSDVTTLAVLGETEHVNTTRAVVAQLQTIAADLRNIGTRPASEALSTVAGKAAVLWTTYLRDCGSDEDRVNGARGTRRQERHADVNAAEQDI